MELNQLQKEILNECIDCIKSWVRDNWGRPIRVRKGQYWEECYRYGGVQLQYKMDDLCQSLPEDELNEFIDYLEEGCNQFNRRW